jgi:hypothetical protein
MSQGFGYCEIMSEDCLEGMTEQQIDRIFRRIRRKLGEPVMGVELEDEQLEECLCEAIEEYSSYIHEWALENRLSQMLGLPNEIDFTLKFVSQNFGFERTFSTAYAEQVSGLGGMNSNRELKLDSINLSAGTQDYIIPAGREINEVLWFTPSFINLFGLDPFANSNIAFSEFGASFAGHTLYHVMPVYDTILTAQAAEMRNKVRGSEYSYRVRGGADGAKVISLYPIPRINNGNGTGASNMGIGGGAGTPGTMFYYYYDKVGIGGNDAMSGFTANPNYTGSTNEVDGLPSQGNGLVSGPSDAKLYNIRFNELNDPAKTWVKKYAQANAKELLGLGVRGKFNGELPIPDASLTMNHTDLITNGREDMAKLREDLRTLLEKLNYKALLENNALMQENINKTLSFGPLPIFLG